MNNTAKCNEKEYSKHNIFKEIKMGGEKIMIIHIYNLLNAPKITEFLIRY